MNDKLNSGTIDALLEDAGMLDDATKSKTFYERLTIWTREVPINAFLKEAQATFQPFTPETLFEKARYATTLAVFTAAAYSGNAVEHEALRRILALENAKTENDDSNTGHVGLDAASNDRIAALEAELATNTATYNDRIAALEIAIANSAGASTAKGLDAASEARIAALEAALAAKADQIELDAASTKIQTGFIVGIVGPVFLVVVLVVAAVCLLRDRGL